ncbi:MAG: CinA family protein [Hyphomicrobiaceae bacterium]
MFTPHLLAEAEALLDRCRVDGLKIVTAESCTGGLIAGLLTEIAGSSDVVERGYVTYSNVAKSEALGVPAALIDVHGAVSRQVALAMAQGALTHSHADLSVAVTGVAGPGGGSTEKPIGLVHIATQRRGHKPQHKECSFGPISRSAIRLATVTKALELLEAVRTDVR